MVFIKSAGFEILCELKNSGKNGARTNDPIMTPKEKVKNILKICLTKFSLLNDKIAILSL